MPRKRCQSMVDAGGKHLYVNSNSPWSRMLMVNVLSVQPAREEWGWNAGS